MEGIITASIAAIATIVTTISTNRSSRKAFELQAKRTNILCLIQMDRLSVLEEKVPQNTLAIHELYDQYVKLGGNSFIVEVVDDYDEWLKEITKGDTMGKCGCKKKSKK